MTRRGWGAWVALVILTGVMVWSGRAASQQATPDLNGQWRLDPRVSDTPPMGGPPSGESGEHHEGGGGGHGGWGGPP
ncbi:MAG: hypothetical protein ACHQ52_14585, partial [Candidatus Eisenbacteria bacterium]